MTLSLSKICFLIALVLFILSIFVAGPLVAAGLAAMAAGHLVP